MNIIAKDERSLLLYLESRAVDYGGLVDARMMNEDDMEIAKQWNTTGFLVFGRIKSDDWCKTNTQCRHWVHLHDAAHEAAAKERLARARRSPHEIVTQYMADEMAADSAT